MRIRLIVPALLALSTALLSCATLPERADPGDEVVVLYQGQSHALGTVQGASPETDNPRVVDVHSGIAGFSARTLGPGVAMVTWVGKDGRPGKRVIYQVLSPELRARQRAVELLVGNLRGVRVSVVGDRIVLDGALQVPETVLNDFDRLLMVQESYRDHVLNLVTLSPALYEAARKKMEAAIRQEAGAKEIAVLWEHGTYLIVGRAADLAQRDRAEVIVQTMLPPMQGSPAVAGNLLVLGAKKFSVRNLVVVGEAGPANRMPASAGR